VIALGVAPGVECHSGVGLPEIGLDVREHAPLDIHHCSAEHECVMLVVDYNLITLFDGVNHIVNNRGFVQDLPYKTF
jgi:hypothetical protein